VAAVVVPDTRVLAVTIAPTDPSAATGQDQVTEEQIVTLELTTTDAQKLAFTQQVGKVWLGLIRPGDRVPKPGPVTLSEVIGR
jgi:Flp pilus assembly protein CpaB